MELDGVQQWVDSVIDQCKKLCEENEFQLRLLGEIKKPWPLSRTPRFVQDSYQQKLMEEKRIEERFTKLSELDEELVNIDAVLQKAKLLHDTNGKNKTKKKNETCEGKTERKRSEQTSNKATAKRTSLSEKSSRGKLASTQNRTVKNIKSTKFRQGHIKDHSASAMQTSARSKGEVVMSLQPPSGFPDNHIVNPIPNPQKHNLPIHTGDSSSKDLDTEAQKSSPPKAEIDIAKVKIRFADFRPQLTLASRTQKLISTYEKLRDQVLQTCNETDDELAFAENLCKKSGCHSKVAQSQTRNSLMRAIFNCLRICTSAINIVQDNKSSCTERQLNYDSCLRSLTLDVVEETFDVLKMKYNEIAYVQGFYCDDAWYDGKLVRPLSTLKHFSHLDGVCDDSLLPVQNICHRSMNSIRRLFSEILTHHSLLIEYELLQRMSDSYFTLLNRLVKSEKDCVPSPDFTHALRNAYAVLLEKNMLLPAFVLEE